MYKLVFTKQASRSLQKMARKTAKIIREKLEQLAADSHARNSNITKLQNRPGYRLRVGDCRVIYEIQNERLVILVLKIAPRGEIYR